MTRSAVEGEDDALGHMEFALSMARQVRDSTTSHPDAPIGTARYLLACRHQLSERQIAAVAIEVEDLQQLLEWALATMRRAKKP